ncbi:MAG: sugar ABC transporter permease [Oscillospiraceae bacterium]|nr:sugar ABC transporter permease [Oscillospiraceae bacterium]
MKRRGLTVVQRRNMAGRAFVYPWFVAAIIFVLIPIVMSLIYTFSNVVIQPTGGYVLTPAGFANWIKAFTLDAFFLDYFYQGLAEVATKLPLILLFSLFAATMLNQKFKGRGFVRSMFFLPVIITSGALVYVLDTNVTSDMFANNGEEAASVMLSNADIQVLILQITNNADLASGIVGIMDQAFVILWASGVQILIFLSGLQSISTSIYESARVDGATGWETFWKITVPMILPLVVVNVLYTIIDTFSNYNSELLRYVQSTIFGKADYAYGTTLSWVYFISMFAIIMVIVFILSRLTKHYSE